MPVYKNKYCLDLFAGSGALGLEAISRGAKYCYFYDLDQKVIKILEKNCKNISEKNKYNVIKKAIDQIKAKNYAEKYAKASIGTNLLH